jgi:MinD-like ATPase involved in chromosome partitioning or flagellar assembly
VGRDFSSVAEVFETVGQVDEISQEMAKKALAEFKPCLILNRVSGSQQFNTGKRRMLLKEYVGGDLENLGELPEDSNVGRSVRSFLPVVDFAPASAASEAFNRIADLFLKRV